MVTLEMLAGLLTTALATGLVFAKVARPTARLLFSRVYGQHVYRREEVIWGAQFCDVMTVDEAGDPIVDYSRFHDVERLGEPK